MDWHAFAKKLLLGGGHLGAAQAAVARAAVLGDGKLSQEEFQFLLDVRREARSVGDDFQGLILELLEKALLRDKKIDADEVKWLRAVFLANRSATADDLRFLRALEEKAAAVCDEFKAMMVEFEGANRTDVFRTTRPAP
jgi:hypothetical protein